MACPALAFLAQAPKARPKTRTDNVQEMLHGIEIVDLYRWLEDQDSPETRAWIKAQNEYTESMLGALAGREQLKQRIAQLLKIDSVSIPRERRGRYFFSKRRADQDLPIIYVREGLKGRDQALIDPHPLSPDRTVSVNLMDISKDGAVVVYGVREGGQDEVTVKLLDVDTRNALPDQLPKARYSGVSIKPDKSGLYYSRYRAGGPRLYYHAMGADPASDRELRSGLRTGENPGVPVSPMTDGI
jgi:prolyl oligopeptidase